MIEIIGTELYQWDVGRSVKVTGASHVHLANQGDSRAVIMELADSQALIPNYLLQTGKQLCVYAVSNGVTIERKTLSVKKRERPADYVYEDDQRNYIYELISSAEQAAADANEAAERATQAASSWAMIGDASGETIVIDDAVEQPFIGFRIFGKTTQDGTPTPGSPVELVSVGDSGSIAVDVAGPSAANGMTVATPNGLPGLPVSSGGNYTDANGQQWICDEVDFARGVYVQRVKQIVLKGTEGFTASWTAFNSCVAFNYPAADKLYTDDKTWADVMCNILPKIKGHDYTHTDNVFGVGGLSFSITFKILKADLGTVAATSADALGDWKSYLAEKYSVGMPVVFAYAIKPIETPLSSEELAAYAALHTYRKKTTVSNDAGAYMELEYSLDAKKYLDKFMSGTIIPATVE